MLLHLRALLAHVPAKKARGFCNRPAVVESFLRSLISASDQGSLSLRPPVAP